MAEEGERGSGGEMTSVKDFEDGFWVPLHMEGVTTAVRIGSVLWTEPSDCWRGSRTVFTPGDVRLIADYFYAKGLEDAAVYIERRDGLIPDRQEIATAIRQMKEGRE